MTQAFVDRQKPTIISLVLLIITLIFFPFYLHETRADETVSVDCTTDPNNSVCQGNKATQESSAVSAKCGNSEDVGGVFQKACEQAGSLANTSQILNVVGETTTSTITSVTGALSSQNVNSQASAYNAAAGAEEISAAGNATLGAADLAIGYMQIKNVQQLNQNTQDLKGAQSLASSLGAAANPATNFDVNSPASVAAVTSQTPGTLSSLTSQPAAAQNSNGASNANSGTGQNSSNSPGAKAALTEIYQQNAGANVDGIGNNYANYLGAGSGTDMNGGQLVGRQTRDQIALNAMSSKAKSTASEQDSMAGQAELATLVTGATALQQLTQAGVSMMEASADKQAAAALNTATTTGVAFAPTADNLSPVTTSDGGSTAVDPGGTANPTPAESPAANATGTNLGSGIDTPTSGGGGGGGVTPSPFTPGQPTAAGGGGSGAPMGGLSTAAVPETPEAQPKAADTGRQNLAYGGGGSAWVPTRATTFRGF
jgi:hypothetical protein